MKLSDLKVNDTIKVDSGFTCMYESLRYVYKNKDGLFVVCDEGHHYLNGQEDENGELVGISWPTGG